MNLNHLRQFIAVAESGSFRVAARTLNLSQSAITKSLKALEDELGVMLVNRGSRGSVLTDSGREFLAHALLIRNEIDVATQRLRQGTNGLRGTVDVGHAGSASIDLLPSVIRYFRARHHDVSISTHGGLTLKLLPRLLDGSLDLLIGPDVEATSSLNVMKMPLFTSQNVIIGRRNHPLRHARSMRDLAGAEWILTKELSQAGSCLDRARELLGLDPLNVVIRSDDSFLSNRLAATTDYLSVTRRSFLDGNFVAQGVVPIEVEDVDLCDQIHLYVRKSSAQTACVQRFIEILSLHAAHLGKPSSGSAEEPDRSDQERLRRTKPATAS